MDGNYSGTLDIRLTACDTIIFLDLPRVLCLWRVLKRLVKYRNKKRPDMADGCFERFDFEFIKFIWGYPQGSKKRMIEKIELYGKQKNIIHLKSRKDVESFLETVKAS